MKTIAMIAAAIVLSVSQALAADMVEGIWQTAPDDNGNFGHVQIAPCSDKLCGVLIKSFGPDGAAIKSDNIGKAIVWDMVPLGGGAYGKGKVWSPDRNKTYKSKMKLAGDRLSVSGCILGICRDGGTWIRVK